MQNCYENVVQNTFLFVKIKLITKFGKMCLHLRKMEEIHENSNDETVLTRPLWYNRKISIGHRTVFYRNWYNKGVNIVKDLIKDSSTYALYSHQEFSQYIVLIQGKT